MAILSESVACFCCSQLVKVMQIGMQVNSDFPRFRHALQTGIVQRVASGLQEVTLPVQAGEAKEQNNNRPQTHVGCFVSTDMAQSLG